MSFSEGGQHSSIKKNLLFLYIPYKSPTLLSIFSQIIQNQLEKH